MKSGRVGAEYSSVGAVKVCEASDGLQTVGALTTVPLRSLQLRIPLRMTPTEATLTHTVTDYTRIHFAGSIPKGEGEVYNTTKVHRYQLPPP